MRSFTVQIPPGADAGDAILLKEGFCIWSVLFGPLWFLWHRLWIGAIGLAVVQAVISGAAEQLGFSPLHAAVPTLGVAVLVGFSARDWWRWRLAKVGYRFADVVVARNQREAEWRWFDRLTRAETQTA